MKYVRLFAIVFTSVAGHLLAAPDNLDERFNQFDINSDGLISGEEMNAAPILKRLDMNRDGQLTKGEAWEALIQLRTGKSSAAASVNPPITPDDTFKEQPKILKPADVGIGHLVADLTLLTSGQKRVQLADFTKGKALVLALFSAHCPISNKLGPELARLEKDYATQGVTFVLVNTVPNESAEDITTFVTKHKLASLVINDPSPKLLQNLQASTTTEVFVLDSARTLFYRGAINDQYGLGYTKDAPTKTYLRDALSALLHQTSPLIAATSAPGCALDLPKATPLESQSQVTYHREVSRILQANCVECHRKDGLGPFSLESLADVQENAAMIRKQVERGAMPPWFANHENVPESPWSNDSSLSAQDKADLLAWLNSNRPEGDAKDAPLLRTFNSSWLIGEPDVVLQIPKPITVKAEGTMPYQNAFVTTSFAEDRWIQAYEIVPTARAVVHHVLVHVHEKGTPIKEHRDGGEGYWAAYVPGNTSRILPSGFAKKLPAGATISFQIHYTPNGTATEDQIKIGLKLAPAPPKYEMHIAAVAQPRLKIPAGAANHIEIKEQRAPMDIMLTAFMAHMHVRGKAFKYEITYPDGRHEVLLDIPKYDFNWQLQYNYKEPKFIPRDSLLKITAIYDNSSANPANPDPTKEVRWGAQTFDEMMIGYIEHYTPVKARNVAGRN